MRRKAGGVGREQGAGREVGAHRDDVAVDRVEGRDDPLPRQLGQQLVALGERQVLVDPAGDGAGAVHPYLADANLAARCTDGYLEDLPLDAAVRQYRQAVCKGIMKVMSKMGISTLQSYRGAQIFECVGLDPSVTDRWFCGTVSRIGGADMLTIAREVELRCAEADKPARSPADTLLPAGGRYKWRREGETHQYNPETIPLLQQAVRQDDGAAWIKFSQAIRDATGKDLGRHEVLDRLRDAPTRCRVVPADEQAVATRTRAPRSRTTKRPATRTARTMNATTVAPLLRIVGMFSYVPNPALDLR